MRWFRHRLQQQQLHLARVHNCHGILYFNKQYKIESKNNKKTTTITRKSGKDHQAEMRARILTEKKCVYIFVISSPFP